MPILSTDPIVLALNDDHDLIIPLRHARGGAAVRQGIDARVKLIKGEVFWNRDAGVPWFDNDIVPEHLAIMGSVFNEERARSELRKAIVATPGVKASSLVMNVAYDNATRTMSISYEVDTDFGDTVADSFEQVL